MELVKKKDPVQHFPSMFSDEKKTVPLRPSKHRLQKEKVKKKVWPSRHLSVI